MDPEYALEELIRALRSQQLCQVSVMQFTLCPLLVTLKSVMNVAVETLLRSINEELLPGKSYYDPVHHAEIPSPLEEHLRVLCNFVTGT